jgi:WD40 repeat protein
MRQARELILRLVTADGTRRVLPRSLLLEGLEEGAEEVLSRLIQARLISTRKAPAVQEGDVNVELAHESLVQTWDRLARWIDESREELVILGELTQAADLWLKRGQRAEEVWQGEALQEAHRYLARGAANIPQRVTRFIEAGMKREQGRLRRKRALVISLIILPTIVAVLFIAKEREAIYQKERAEKQWTRAEEERKRARRRWAEAQREGARAALAQEATLEARAKVRGSLERQDSLLARVLWWRLQQQPLLWKKELGNGVYHLAFSPDGKTVAAACQDSTIYLFDIQTKAIRLLRGHKDQVFSVAYSPDGRKLASGGWDNSVRIWDISTGESEVLRGHKRGVRSVTFSPDGRSLASGSGDTTVRVWDLASGQTRWILRGHKQTVYSLAASPDGTYLASSGRDTVVMIWDLRTGELIHKLAGHRDGVEGLGFSPDSRRLASGSWDRTIRLWDLTTGKALYILKGHAANVEDVVFSPDGEQLASGSWDQTIRIWDLASKETVQVLRGHTGGLYTMAQSPDGRLLASGSWDKSIRVWHVPGPTGSERVEPAGHTGAVYGVAFSSDGKTLVTGSLDKTVRLWDVRSGAQRKVLRGHTNAVEGVAISGDGRYVASGGSDMSVRIWDLSSDTQKRMLLGHTAEITGMSFSADGKLLATVSLDKTARLWDWRAGRLARALRGHAAGVRIVAFSRDGRMLATGSHDHTARVWWLARGTLRLTVTQHSGAVFGAAFSPDSRLLATGSQDQTIRLHDLARGTSRLVGRHDGRIYMIDYHPDGRHIGAPSSDGVARIWDLRTGRSIPLTGHRSEVNYLRFSPDGELAATSSDDGTVRLWEVESGRPHWRAPLMLPRPPRLLTHLGWTALAPRSGERARPVLPEASWRRTAEQRARFGSVTGDGKQLCLGTTDGNLEYWDLVEDRRLFSRPADDLKQVLAVPGGCLTLAAEKHGARLLTKGRPIRVLRASASAIALDRGEILVATGMGIQIFSASGQHRSTIQGGGIGVSALRRVGRWLALGFANGSIELIPIRGGAKPTFSFEQTPSSPVVRLVEGPMQTLIAGYANGLIGIWNLDNGSRLYQIRLHGAVHHLLLEDRHLYAATDLGQHAVLDLGVLHVGYCDLLGEVWRRIPVVWEGGLPVLRPPPEGHRCRSGSRDK